MVWHRIATRNQTKEYPVYQSTYHLIQLPIDRHGGKIEVESEVGKGTEFVVTLPVNPPIETTSAT